MSDAAPHVWRATPHEAETVAELLVEFRDHIGRDWPSDNAFHAGVERMLERNEADFLLASAADGAPAAGVCQLRFGFNLWRAGTECVLEDLFVRERARREGLGAALVTAALERARERNSRWIELDAYEDNAPAIALYERFGFVLGRSGGRREIVLARSLDDPR
ncbi:N-acetyltransferase [Conexibacter sp. CPCC 206217]|uniref:GNAT family N-acetyltransferase n=1 Tax=Conexibacter sp. CPCC 206217 TaxID=3064574 RepID=UPI0027163776|nr:GNAT family N-acetyltransferase [Conexibacter sp. CPCC 206217]MDO8210064.1 GNAT family N-acetyltransferase [Conexibacter sp. CPCC 206217]